MSNANTLLEKSEPKPVKILALVLNLIAGAALMGLMLITCVDVFGRYFFNHPLTGSTELSESLLGVMIFTALPVISWRNEQVVVDILDSYVPPKLHLIRNVLFNVIAAIALGFMGKRIIELGLRALKSGEVTEYLHISIGNLLYFFGIMCWLTAIAYLTLGIYRAWIEYRLATSRTEVTA